jgi:hypothetical protein
MHHYHSNILDLCFQNNKVFDLSQQANQCRVKVDTDETLDSDFGFFSHEQELVQVLLSVFLNTLDPLVNFCLFKLLDGLAERVVQLLHIFELFTLLDGLG